MVEVVIKSARSLIARGKECRTSEGGMSLIEVLVALAIFSLVVVAFTAYFINTFMIVHIAARKSKTVFSAQAGTEEQIATTVGDDDTLHIQYPGSPVDVKGKFVVVEGTDNEGRVVRMEVFVPHVFESSED
jgi:prepilin-type N-terminal cleavage/methylation domain-containing protein